MLRAYLVVLVIRAVLSFVPSLRGRWTVIVDRLVDPVMRPVERVVPPIAGFSVAYILVFFAVQLLTNFFANEAYACAYRN